MFKKSIIQRRELEPLWEKAGKIIRHYEKAANCISAVMGADCISVDYTGHPKTLLFCSLCKRYDKFASRLKSYEYPCADMHRCMAVKTGRFGELTVYTCPVGFFFWTSPFFSGERFAGALMSGGALSVDTQKAEDKISEICKGEVSRAEIAEYLDGIPEKSRTDVESLARVMQLCAEKLSSSEDNVDGPDEEIMQNGRNNPMDYTDHERRLFACLRRGDNAESRRIVQEISNGVNDASGGNFDYAKLKAIELVTLLSRAGTHSDNVGDFIETNNRYLKRIDESKTTGEITDNLCLATEMAAGSIFSFKGIRHASALRKAERFIWENYTRKLSLREVADVSGLSAPYFSTVFKDEMGENFSHYLNRLRVEKASSMLKETDISFGKVSAACGFEDQAWFSKIFKSFTGISPCKYREVGGTLPQ